MASRLARQTPGHSGATNAVADGSKPAPDPADGRGLALRGPSSGHPAPPSCGTYSKTACSSFSAAASTMGCSVGGKLAVMSSNQDRTIRSTSARLRAPAIATCAVVLAAIASSTNSRAEISRFSSSRIGWSFRRLKGLSAPGWAATPAPALAQSSPPSRTRHPVPRPPFLITPGTPAP